MGEKSEKAFPFDSDKDSLGNNDREYYADDFARYFRSFISSGVFMKNADNLQILANDDMTVTLRPGSAIIDGYKYDNTADIVVELEPADGVLNRIDRISVTWSKGERDIHKTVQKGISSYEPIAQECRRNEEYKDYVLADIYIPAGAIKITQDNITDQRLNTDVCGLAIAFSDIDTTMIFNQLQAFYEKVVEENADWEDEKQEAFDIWFSSIKEQLSGDVAGNLQMQIGTLENLLTNAKDNLVEAVNEIASKKIDVLKSMEEIEANTDDNAVAGAMAVKELNASLTADTLKFQFATDGEGNYGYLGADDSFIPFKNGGDCPCMVLTAYYTGINQHSMFIYFNEEGIPLGFFVFVNSSTAYSNKDMFDANILAYTRAASGATSKITALQDLYYIRAINNGTISEKIKMNKGDTITISSSANTNSAYVFTFS